MAKVLILGGGFGGLAAAHELRSSLPDEDEITLVDRGDRFYMGFAKLWDLGGVRPLAAGTRSLTALSDRGIAFRRAEVTGIDAHTRTVETSVGAMQADAILVALGAGPLLGHLQLLRGEGAHDLYDGAALPEMRRDLDRLERGRVLITILGGPFKCPPAPYEAALLIDEQLRQRGVRDEVEVVLATPQPMTLPAAGVDASRYVAQHLDDRGVRLIAERAVSAVDPGTRTVTLSDGTELAYSLLLGVPAAAPPAAIAQSDLVGPSGWIEPDRHTLSTTFDGVYAVGDCTHIPNAVGALPKAGVFAAGAGEVAARNIAAGLHGGEPSSFDGRGFCFLELPGRRVAFVEGDFYAEPEPDVTLSEADEQRFERKVAYEHEHLEAWLG